MTEVKTILCAVDFSGHSTEVVEYSRLIARSLGARIKVIYVAPSLSQYVGFHVPPTSIESFVGEIVTGAEKTMNTFLEEHFSGCEAEGVVVSGYAAEEILDYASEHSVDMIIMGTHGRKGIDRILFGSVAEKVVRTSLVPVLTVRPSAS